jgi:hypothetical protein
VTPKKVTCLSFNYQDIDGMVDIPRDLRDPLAP